MASISPESPINLSLNDPHLVEGDGEPGEVADTPAVPVPGGARVIPGGMVTVCKGLEAAYMPRCSIPASQATFLRACLMLAWGQYHHIPILTTAPTHQVEVCHVVTVHQDSLRPEAQEPRGGERVHVSSTGER